MAESPSHKFGQIIGDLMEIALNPLLVEFADKYGLYLDKKGLRKARGKNKKVSWVDIYGNKHDLDFVLERGGSESVIGEPIAFIEVAWRRYTKHSRNKAQEIQGAIMPLRETHRNNAPFVGVFLSGVFTDGALKQLESLGFNILYFEYETVVEAFKHVSIDASFDEDTSDDEFKKKIDAWESLTDEECSILVNRLIELNSSGLKKFMSSLERTITRQIESVRVLPLHGEASEYASISEVLSFIETYDESNAVSEFVKYEIIVKYNNGDKINAEFRGKDSAIEFLKSFLPPVFKPEI
ncbi:hypothetical protein NDK47_22070 [Brevibacillus ruminantium]|uniref:DNA methylase n=1 Tax=Brevibacillus ruminantium TaxID=2950604 RepID=A0ABY4WC77_9BACL|nr:hypothetical protein [Brevibacillus ruminantium]USG64783.1 hypothetical protein NDK47_22070 [Brevibacillus ruminantium]